MNIALVFGYGQKADGSIDEQTTDRCNKAVCLYRSGQIDIIYLTVSAEKSQKAMAHMMGQYLILRGVPESIITYDRRGGNTAGEMDVFIRAVGDVNMSDTLIFISTWYHIPRIMWLAWWRVHDCRFSLAIAWKHAHWKADVLKEFLKLANAILRPRSSAKVLASAPV